MRIKRRQFNEFVAGNFLMAILKPQFQAPPGEQQGNGGISANKVRSGRFTGRYQLTGELLVLKDTQDSVSGYIAFGTTMATMPTTASSGTGMYLDYTGIYGLASGTKQFYLQASDGKAYAGAGAVILDASGVSLTVGTAATNQVKWVSGATTVTTLNTQISSNIVSGQWLVRGKDATDHDGKILITTSDYQLANDASIVMLSDSGSNASSIQLYNGATARISSDSAGRVQLVGSLRLSYIAKTANYTAADTDYAIDCTSGTFTVTLPTAVAKAGRVYIVKNSGAGTITVGTTSTQTIDGAASVSLSVQYQRVVVMSDGANWIILNQ